MKYQDPSMHSSKVTGDIQKCDAHERTSRKQYDPVGGRLRESLCDKRDKTKMTSLSIRHPFHFCGNCFSFLGKNVQRAFEQPGTYLQQPSQDRISVWHKLMFRFPATTLISQRRDHQTQSCQRLVDIAPLPQPVPHGSCLLGSLTASQVNQTQLAHFLTRHLKYVSKYRTSVTFTLLIMLQ